MCHGGHWDGGWGLRGPPVRVEAELAVFVNHHDVPTRAHDGHSQAFGAHVARALRLGAVGGGGEDVGEEGVLLPNGADVLVPWHHVAALRAGVAKDVPAQAAACACACACLCVCYP